MRKLHALIFILTSHFFLLPTAFAKEQPQALMPLPSVDDFSKGKDGWSLGLGVGLEYETAYEGSDEFGLEVQPAGALQWRSGDHVLFFAGEALGWRAVLDTQWLLEAVVGFDEGREENDSKDGHLRGLGQQEEGTEFILQARRAFSADWRYWLVGRVVMAGHGQLGLFGIGRRFGEQLDGTGSEVNVVIVAHDSEYANHGFGINAAQAIASGLQETHLKGGLRSVGIDYNFRHYVNDHWQIYGEALFEYFSSEVRKSPIARNNYETEIGIGFIYLF